MNASLPLKPVQGNAGDTLVVKPYQSVDWPALWQLRACQLAEGGIMVDAIDAVPSFPDLNSPYERDYHRMEQVYLSGRGKFWIAWSMGNPVGHIGAQDMGDFIELRRMYVREEYRRQGIGSQLLHALIEHSSHHCVRLIKLWTDPGGPGRLVYKKMGFCEVEEPGKAGKLLTDDKGEIRMCFITTD